MKKRLEATKGALVLCFGLVALAGLSGAPTIRASEMTAQVKPLPDAGETTIGLPPTDLTETGFARQRQRKDVQDRSLYTDGASRVTSTQIRDFLTRHKSPMAGHAEEIVLAGNRYGIDPRMIVAIAGVESQYGRRCRGFNAWGWNGGRQTWSSWSESIDEYSERMGSNYPNWRNVRRVAPRYNPNTPEAWGRKVAFLMVAIQKPV